MLTFHRKTLKAKQKLPLLAITWYYEQQRMANIKCKQLSNKCLQLEISNTCKSASVRCTDYGASTKSMSL